jgi:hypothetical protein
MVALRASLRSLLGLGLALAAVACVDDTPASPGADPCDTYCSEIAKACTGDDAQYIDDVTCKAMCQVMDRGNARDTTGDSVACRRNMLSNVREAQNAKEKRDFCVKSGPYGTTCSPDECTAFCRLNLRICVAADQAFPNNEECLKNCNAVKAKPGDLTSLPLTSTTGGDNFVCRAYHLEAASTSRVLHCKHTRGEGACNP